MSYVIEDRVANARFDIPEDAGVSILVDELFEVEQQGTLARSWIKTMLNISAL